MQRSGFITATLIAAAVTIAACNAPSSDRDAESVSSAPDGEAAVATSGTVDAVLDDSAITSRIQAKYFLDPTIKGRRIQVDTQNGIVTLRGEVASDNERAQALLLARTTEGADRVEDALTVNAGLDASTAGAPSDVPTPPNADDEALTALVQSRLGDDTSLNATTTITVTAKDGVVLVDGTAPTAAAKQRALSIARGTDGVVQVIDRIRVTR